MYAIKYGEEFHPHLQNFVSAVWQLLTSTGLQERIDEFMKWSRNNATTDLATDRLVAINKFVIFTTTKGSKISCRKWPIIFCSSLQAKQLLIIYSSSNIHEIVFLIQQSRNTIYWYQLH